MVMKTESISLIMNDDVQTVGRKLQGALSLAKAQSIGEMESSSGALSKFDDRAAIEVVASGQGMVGGGWTVQVYVQDQQEQCEVVLVALGDGSFARAMGGARNTTSLSASIKKRDQIAASLRDS